jgi:hypothetical protein
MVTMMFQKHLSPQMMMTLTLYHQRLIYPSQGMRRNQTHPRKIELR